MDTYLPNYIHTYLFKCERAYLCTYMCVNTHVIDGRIYTVYMDSFYGALSFLRVSLH